jgi:hypothetical protein
MTIDEIEVFRTACATAHDRSWTWRPPFFIGFDAGEWQVQAENESIIRINGETGRVVAESDRLDPALALAIAREYAIANSLRWKPAFTLQINEEGWEVGCCQSQFGGQTYITVSHNGKAIRHWINPK